jgi:hypothetical protein
MQWNNVPFEWVPILFGTDYTECGVYGFMLLESNVALNVQWGSGNTFTFPAGTLKIGVPYVGRVAKIVASGTTATQGKVLLAVSSRVDGSKRFS